MSYNTQEIKHACKSKHNLRHKDPLILFIVIDGEKLRYLSVKTFSALLRGITSKYEGNFYCLNCFHSYSTKDKLKNHKDVCENHDLLLWKCLKKITKYYNKIMEKNLRKFHLLFILI